MTNKEKGDRYEAYIAGIYRKRKYRVIENGKEKGRLDGGIDLIAIKDNIVIFIQCKDWNENNSHKITHENIKILRINVQDFIERNLIYKNYKIELKYTLSGNFIHKSAEKYMQECKEKISHEIIKPLYNEYKNNSNTKEKPRYKKKKENNIGKLIIAIVIIVIIVIILNILAATKKRENPQNINPQKITIKDRIKQKIEPIKPIKEIIFKSIAKEIYIEESKVVKSINNKKITNKKNKRSASDYLNENNKYKRILQKKKLDYNTIFKQKKYNKNFKKNTLFQSREEIMLENRILKKMAIENNIEVFYMRKKSNSEELKKKIKKEELKRQMPL